MAYRNKVFISFDGDTDMYYYRLMRAWKQNDHTNFNFYDAHDLTQARDTSTEDSIKRSLSERLANAKVVVSLIGENTRYLYKFLRWELEQAIRRDIPIVGVNRSGPRNLDSGLSEISIVFQAAVPKLVASKYTTSGVRRPSAL